MKNAYIIVDAYSSGLLLIDALKEKLINDNESVIIHMKVTHSPFTAMPLSEINKYDVHIVFNGNIDDLLSKLKEYNVKAVIVGQEPGVELADILSERLGLNTSNGTQKSEARRNKYEMRRVVAEAGLLVPKFMKSTDVNEILTWSRDTASYPVVLKSLRSAGTDGVYICRNEGELKNAFDKIYRSETIFNETNTEVLVETFLEGSEYVVNAVSLNGRHYVTDVWVYQKKFIPGYGNVYDKDILLPSNAPEVDALIRYNSAVLDALGINNGPSHAEIMYTPNGPALVEVGARLSGVVHPKLNTLCVGHDQVHMTIDCYTDREKFTKTTHTHYSLHKHAMVVDDIYEGVPGQIESINEAVLDEIRSLPSVAQVIIKVKPGTTLSPTVTLINSPARLFLVHEDKQQIEADYARYQQLKRSLFRITPQLSVRPATLIEAIRSKDLNHDKTSSEAGMTAHANRLP